MKSFEEHLRSETRKSCLRDTQWRLERDRRRAAETRKMRRILLFAYLIAFLSVIVLAAAMVLLSPSEPELVMPAPEAPAVQHLPAVEAETDPVRSDVPLDDAVQRDLLAACEEFGVEFELMLGLIERESTFRNVTGDSGESVGYCQIQPKWWGDLMDDIGAEDLSVPRDNFRTACAILVHLSDCYGSLEDTLTAYNTGAPGSSAYANSVLENAEKWRG